MTQSEPKPVRRPIRSEDLPDLARTVGLFGSAGRSEVGGSICFGVVVTTGVHSSG